jgi:hypothetical protein
VKYADPALLLMLGPHTPHMKQLRNVADPPERPISPSWKQWRGLLYVEGQRSLVGVAGLLRSRVLRYLLGFLGLVIQMVLLTLTWELVGVVADVSELWLALARKHLELTNGG